MLSCKKCGEEKPRTQFYKEKRTKRGYQARCKDCCKADAKAVFEANPEPYKQRSKAQHADGTHRRKRTLAQHGLSQEDYDRMLEKQGGHCALCPATVSGHNMTDLLLIDHCHETNRVRGLLCQDCNLLLGCIKDERKRLIAAMFYLHDKKRNEKADS